MAISDQVKRLQDERDLIRTKLIGLGISSSTDKLEDLRKDIQGIANNGAISETITLSGTSRSGSYTVPAGYHNGNGKVSTNIPAGFYDISGVTASAADVRSTSKFVNSSGTLTTGTMPNAVITSGSASATISTPSYNSTDDNFTQSASGTVNAPSVGTAGYISSSAGTKNTNSISGSKTLSKVRTGVDITGDSTKAPTLKRTVKPSGDTWVDAASGNATTTKPTAGPYVQIDADANTGTLTATPKVTSAGYGTTSNYGSTAGTKTVGASKATTAYVPITTTSASVSGKTVSYGTGWITGGSSSVADGTAGTPSASKGTVSNNSITITPSVTNTTGYITGGTKTGTGVTVSASELVSGNKSLSSGTSAQTNIDVTNYKTVSISAIASASPSFDGGGISLSSSGSTASGSNVTLNTITSTDSGNGITINTGASTKVTRADVLYNGAVEGYVSKADNAVALSGTTDSSARTWNGTSYYITALTVPKSKNFALTTQTNTAADASTITINNGAYRNLSVTNASNGNTTVTNNGSLTVEHGSGSVTVKAKNSSSDSTISNATVVSNGVWSNQTVYPSTSDTLKYGRVTVKGLSSSNYSADNIKSGVTISVSNGNGNVYSVQGTYTNESSNPITAATVLNGKVGYVNGSKITGSMANNGAGTTTTLNGSVTSKTIAAGYWSSANIVNISVASLSDVKSKLGL